VGKKEKTCPITGLDRSVGRQEMKAPITCRQATREGDKLVSLKHRPPLPPRR